MPIYIFIYLIKHVFVIQLLTVRKTVVKQAVNIANRWPI